MYENRRTTWISLKVRKIKISQTCNYCFAFSEIASPSVHTIVLLKYRFDLQIGCWSFTEITFLDSDQTELFAFSIKISRSWNFLTCFVYDFLKFNTTEIAELALAQISLSHHATRAGFLLITEHLHKLSAREKIKNQNKEIWKKVEVKKKAIYKISLQNKPGHNFRHLSHFMD